MVKFNKILAVVCASTFSAVLAANSTDEYGKDCKDIEEFLSQYNLTAERCGTDADNQVDFITIEGDSINQKVIDKIGSYSTIKEVSFRGIKNIPKKLNLEPLHISNLSFSEKITIDTPDQPVLSIPKGVLKTAKSVKDISFIDYKISQNNVNEINSLTNLVNLSYYSCAFDKGIDYSKFKNLKKLESLTILGTSKGVPFDEMSKSICQLKKLEYLTLECEAKSIPKCFGNLTNLKSLELLGNNFKALPEEIGKLTKLKVLGLTGNKFTSIPAVVGKLTSLERLSLTDNQISKIPSTISKLKNLKDLFIAANKIKVIPESITKLQNLEKLYLNSNLITDIPEFLAKLKKLDSLDLSKNKIDAEIPESLNELTELISFELDGNVDIRGKTLSNANLLFCSYNVGNNKSENKLCQEANNSCTVKDLQYC